MSIVYARMNINATDTRVDDKKCPREKRHTFYFANNGK